MKVSGQRVGFRLFHVQIHRASERRSGGGMLGVEFCAGLPRCDDCWVIAGSLGSLGSLGSGSGPHRR